MAGIVGAVGAAAAVWLYWLVRGLHPERTNRPQDCKPPPAT